MISITDQKGTTLLNTDLRNSSQNEMKFEQAFYFGQQFIQFSSYLDFTDSLLYGLKAFNSSDKDSLLMNPRDHSSRKSFVIWDN